MLTDLQMRNFRCLESLALQLESDFNFFVGANGQGKTSILEAACVLLRLQSQRSSSLAPLIRLGEKSLLVAGHYDDHVLRFRYSGLRRKVEFDEIEQRTLAEYLRLARVVSLANADIELVRGSSEARRRYLDFVGTQIDPLYRPALRGYERALRSRNALLKSPQPRPREITAYDAPLLAHGTSLMSMRAAFVERLAPVAAQAHREISGGSDEVLRRRVGADPRAGNAFAPNRRRSAPGRNRTVCAGDADDSVRFGRAATHSRAGAEAGASASFCGRTRRIASAFVNRRHFWRTRSRPAQRSAGAFA